MHLTDQQLAAKSYCSIWAASNKHMSRDVFCICIFAVFVGGFVGGGLSEAGNLGLNQRERVPAA